MGVTTKRYDMRFDGSRFVLVGRNCDDEGNDARGDAAYWVDQAVCKDWVTAMELLRGLRREER